MTRRQELDHQLRTFSEISGIMAAMKNLALVEIRKLNRMRDSHATMQQTIRAATEDFFAFHPYLRLERGDGAPLLLLMGSERGFCGSFNQNLLDAVESHLESRPDWAPRFIPVGSKLATKLENDGRVVRSIPGASAAEEVVRVLAQVLVDLQSLPESGGGLGQLDLWAAYHDYDEGGVQFEDLTSFPSGEPIDVPHTYPPTLQLDPPVFLTGLLEHYMFALLTRIFFTSLMVENRHRLAHMENATRRIQGKTEELTLTRNILRQEEITQEIEIILLNTADESLDQAMFPGTRPKAAPRR